MTYVLALALMSAAVAAYTDFRKSEIPNWLTFGTFGVGILYAAAHAAARTGSLKAALLASLGALVGGLACGVVPFLLWRRGVMGGGDVKLFVALGALCQPAVGLDIEFTAFICGSLLAPVKLAFDGHLLASFKRTGKLIANMVLPASKRFELPSSELTWFRFGPVILLATLWVTWSRWGHV